jgi:hypothetical protein
LQSPFVAGEGKLFKHDDNVLVFENYKDNVDEVDRSAFMAWFQRGYKPKNRYVPFVCRFERFSRTHCNIVS